MTSTSNNPYDNHRLLSHRFQGADIEAEYDQQRNIKPHDAQGAPAENLEWHGVELTPMLCRSDTRVWRSPC